MSEFWDQPAPDFDVSGPGDPYEPGFDLPADVAVDPGSGAEIDPYVEAPPPVYGPTWDPTAVTCCDCATPGWEPALGGQLEDTWAAEPPAASVVLAQGAYDPGWSSWDAVAADPSAGVVTVGQPLAQAFPGYTVTAEAGQVVDPSTVYPTSFTVGGQGLGGAFTVVPADPIAVPPTTTMVIGGDSLYGDFTITDPAGNPVDPNASFAGMATIGGPSAGLGQMTITDAAGNTVDPSLLMPSVITIGGPSAGLGNIAGSSPLSSLHTLLAMALERGDAASAATFQAMIASQIHMSEIWTAPSNVIFERRY